MILPQELRLGNLVEYEKTTHVITGIITDKILSRWIKQPVTEHDYACHFSEISEIPLTEEWLVKMGSEIKFHPAGDGSYYSYTINGVQITWGGSGEYRFVFRNNICSIKYVHQLQNLFRCLCGKELEIKL